MEPTEEALRRPAPMVVIRPAPPEQQQQHQQQQQQQQPPPQPGRDRLCRWVDPVDNTTPRPPTLDKPWLRLIQDPKTNFGDVADRIWEDEKTVNTGLVKTFDRKAVWITTRKILASTSNALLKEVCFGNLSRARHTKQAVRDELDSNAKRNRELDQPAIYVIELVKKDNHRAPTPNDMIKILQIADRYAHGEEYVVKRVDIWMKTGSKERQRYLPNDSAKRKYKELRDNMLALFRDMTDEEKDVSLGQPLRDVGYADDAFRRIKEHSKHTGSNYLLNLFEAVACEFWPDEFETQSHIVYLIWEVLGCTIAEMVFSVLGSSYIRTGLGFNHVAAGGSNTTAWRTPWDWHTILQATRYCTPFIERMKIDNQKLDAIHKSESELKEIREQIKEARRAAQSQGQSQASASGTQEAVLRGDLASTKNEIELLKLLDSDLDYFYRGS